MKRTLTLRREALVELTVGDLAAVNGASGLPCDPTDPTKTIPVVTSINYPCTTTGPIQ